MLFPKRPTQLALFAFQRNDRLPNFPDGRSIFAGEKKKKMLKHIQRRPRNAATNAATVCSLPISARVISPPEHNQLPAAVGAEKNRGQKSKRCRLFFRLSRSPSAWPPVLLKMCVGRNKEIEVKNSSGIAATGKAPSPLLYSLARSFSGKHLLVMKGRDPRVCLSLCTHADDSKHDQV